LSNGSGAGPFGHGLRRFDIHDGFLPTSFAFSRQMVDGGLRVDFQNLSFAADWAHNPSVLYDQFSTFGIHLQFLSPVFVSYSTRFQDRESLI
jgi:hypothetical protein